MTQPSLNSVSPTSYLANNNGQTMELLGSNFVSGDKLTFVDPQGNIYSNEAANFITSSELETTFNNGNDPGTWKVEVNSSSGNSSFVSFNVTAAQPSLNSVSPTSYLANNNGQTMELLGSNFVSGDKLTFVDPQGNIYSNEAANFITSSELETTFNNGNDPGTWKVEVNSSSGNSSFVSFNVTAAQPSLNSVSPTSYLANNNGQTMELLGSNFVSGDKLTFVDPQGNIYSNEAANFITSSELETTFNNGNDPGTWKVEVNSSSGNSSFVSFNVTAAQPSLNSVSPTSYLANNNGQTMELLGSNFVSGDKLTFVDPQGNIYSNEAANFITSSELETTFNNGNDPGTWKVEVNSSSGNSSFVSFNVTAGSSTVDPFISYTDVTPNQPIAADVVGAAEKYIGATWAANNCTGLVWAVSVAIGAPFYETIQTVTNGQATNASQLSVVPDNGYIVPPTQPEAGSSSDWTTFFSSNWTAQVQVGDLVRIPGTVNLGTTDPDSGHSFIVVGNSDIANPTDPNSWLVIDNTVQNPSGSTVQISNPHTFDNAGNTFDMDVLQAGSAYVSYLTSSASTPPPPTVIRTDTNSFGTTKLTQVGNEYFLYGASGTSGPAITYNGSAVTVGQFGSGVAPIGAALTASGYEVAWLIPGSPNQYAIWVTNSSGVFQSSSAALTGTSSQLEQAELTFNQDLNNDGSIGPPPPPPPTVIRTDTNSFGTTKLTQVGNEYFLYGASGTSGPAITYNGSAVTVGQFGSGVAPIGAAPTSNGGYEIAWLIPGSPNQWAIWNTNSSGVFQSSSAALTGTSSQLEQAELTFNQDLNNDGSIGPPPPPPPTVIRTDTNSFGTTKLTQVGNEYFLYGAGGTSGPAITYNGSAVTVGQFGSGVAPIGAALTASGYEVAWLIPGSPNQYAIWVTNSSGVFQSSSAALTGTSSQLEQAELTFNQDLNNDGSIGPPPPPPPTVIRTDTNSFGTTKLTQVGNEYFLYGASGTSGPAITYNGSAVTVGQFGSGVAPIGAAPTSNGGYEIAWLIPGSPNQWAIWNTNSSGVFQSSSAALTGTSSQLEQAELTFNQDLNNDGSIGPPPPPPPTVIRTDTNSFGTTELVQVGNEYFLYGASGTSGPAINYNGSAVTVGQFGSGVVPIGAAPTSNGGYEIAWLIPGSPNQWAIWNTDSSGNFQSSSAALTASSPTLQQAEVAMNQDLNQNGTIGTSQGSSQGSSSASATIAAGDTLEIASASSGSVTFQASTGTLQLDQPSTFTGWISGFTGDGSLSGSDQIDLRGIAFNSVQDGYTNNVLSVGDSSGDTARLDFIGTYSLANFKFASDNNGGTIVYDPPVQSPGATATLLADLSTIGSATPLAGFDTNAPIGGAANDISSLTSLAASQIHHS